MTEGARVRIVRVRMKAGGADVRVLHRAGQGDLEQHLREWVDNTLCDGTRPDAYAAVAFWIDPATPGLPTHNTTYFTRHDGLPVPLLCQIAAAYIRQECAVAAGKSRALDALGASEGPWEPEPTG